MYRSQRVRNRLVVHVGRHKTGSTSLQRALSSHGLDPFGILYARSVRLGAQHAALPALFIARDLDLDASTDLLNALEQEINSVEPRLTILSSEVFCELAKREPRRCVLLLSLMADRWDLDLIQVVRPFPAYFLSALKHQLRAGTFLSRSPLTWYRHCQDKTSILDSFWTHAGYRLTTLPYVAEDACLPVISLLSELAGLSPSAQDRLNAQLPTYRENVSTFDESWHSAYFIYLVAARESVLLSEKSPLLASLRPHSILDYEQFVTCLLGDPLLQQDLENSELGDKILFEFCQSHAEASNYDDHVFSDWQCLQRSNLFAASPSRFLDWLNANSPKLAQG